MTQVRLRIRPVSLKEANAFVESLHRHHKKVTGHRFSIGAETPDGKLVGVAIVGRPVARMVDQNNVLEVTRLCTDGTANACSALYAAAARAGKAMGYQKIQTYILTTEPGTSLRASGWSMEAETGGGSWSRDSRPRVDKAPVEVKQRWALTLNGVAS